MLSKIHREFPKSLLTKIFQKIFGYFLEIFLINVEKQRLLSYDVLVCVKSEVVHMITFRHHYCYQIG